MKLPDKISNKIESIVLFVKNADAKTRYYIFGGILVFILVLDYLILMGPQLSRLTKISGDIKNLETQIGMTKNNILRLNQYRSEVASLKESIKEGQLKIMSKEEVPLILENVSRLAGENNVIINEISPVSSSEKEILENNERKYFSLPIKIDAKSGYHDFGRFLNALEKGNILFKIASFSLASEKGDKDQKLDLVLDTIIYQDIEKDK